MFARMIAIGFFLALFGCGAQTSGPKIEPRVLVVTTFYGEAQPWILGQDLALRPRANLFEGPLYCNPSATLCLIISGEGESNALAALLLVGLSDNVDLSQSYILIAGIAGTPPSNGTIGMAAWARYIVNGDLAFEIDPRELPAGRPFARFQLGCTEQWCGEKGRRVGTEIYHLNERTSAWAYKISSHVEMLDSSTVSAYKRLFPKNLHAQARPTVTRCDIVSGVGSSRVDLQACKLEYSIVSPK